MERLFNAMDVALKKSFKCEVKENETNQSLTRILLK